MPASSHNINSYSSVQ